MLTLIEKDDVIVGRCRYIGKDKDIGEDKDKDNVRDECGKYRYRGAVEGYVDEWKRKIGESPDGKIVVRIRYIREDILGKWFEDKSDMAIYMRVKHILLEYGIDVRLKHHYGANLVMTIANEGDIISDNERARIVRETNAKKLGFDNFFEYKRTTEGYKRDHTPYYEDFGCTKYIGLYIEKKIMNAVFEDAEKNPITTSLLGAALWDWKTKDGILIKHIASCYHYDTKINKSNGKEYEWEGYHWNTYRNKVPHFYLLIGYNDDRENLDINNAWLIPTKERIRRREFWDREGFSIRCDKGAQLLEMKKYEIGNEKLNEIRKIIRQFSPIVIDIDDIHIDIRKQILEWYSTYWRDFR